MLFPDQPHNTMMNTLLTTFLRLLILSLPVLLLGCGGGSSGGEDRQLLGLTVGQSELSLPMNTRIQVQPQLKYTDGSLEPYDGDVTWSIEHEGLLGLEGRQITSYNRTGVTALTIQSADEKLKGEFQVHIMDLALDKVSVQGEGNRLSITGYYEDNSTQDLSRHFQIFSSDEQVLKVADNGALQIQNDGAASLVLRDPFLYSTYEFDVTVSNQQMQVGAQKTPTRLELELTNSELAAGQTTHARVMASYADGSSRDVTAFVAWVLDNADHISLGEVVEDGKIVETTGESTGDVLLAEYAGKQAQATLVMTGEILESLRLSHSLEALSWPKGESHPFQAFGVYSLSGEQDLTAEVNWQSSDGNVVQFDTDTAGLLRSPGQGQASISASYQGKSASLEVSVGEPLLYRVEIRPPLSEVENNSSVPLTAFAVYSDREENITAAADWQAGNDKISLVDGTLNALSEGGSSVSISYAGMSSEQTFDITPEIPSEVILSVAATEVATGLSLEMQVEGVFQAGTQSLARFLEWQIEKPLVLQVNADGSLRGRAEGSSSISVSYLGVVSGPVTIDVLPPVLKNLAVVVPATRLPAEATIEVGVQGFGSDGRVYQGDFNVLWALEGSADAAIEPAPGGGYLLSTGSTIGPLSLTASVEGNDLVAQRSLELEITEAGVDTLHLTPASLEMREGEQQVLGVIAVLADGTVSSPGDLKCISSDRSVVDAQALPGKCELKALAEGSSTISAAYQDGTTVNSSQSQVQVQGFPSLGSLDDGDRFTMQSSRWQTTAPLSSMIGGAVLGNLYTVIFRHADGGALDSATEVWVSPSKGYLREPGLCRAYLAEGRDAVACSLNADSGEIYLGIWDSNGGTPLTVEVQPGGYRNSGTAAQRTALSIDTVSRSGQVTANANYGLSASYYTITDLEPTKIYRVALIGVEETVQLRVHAPGQSEPACVAPATIADHVPGTDISCDADVGIADSLHVDVIGFSDSLPVLGASSIGGAAFQLQVTEVIN